MSTQAQAVFPENNNGTISSLYRGMVGALGSVNRTVCPSRYSYTLSCSTLPDNIDHWVVII